MLATPCFACRPDNGRHVDRNGFRYTNQWVSEYNPGLLLCMHTHINVQITIGFASFKYMFQYLSKTFDNVVVTLRQQLFGTDPTPRNPHDETERFLNARCIGSMEAVHHIMGYPLDKLHPACMLLPLHEEDGQRVVLHGNSRAVHYSTPPHTCNTPYLYTLTPHAHNITS